MNFEETLIEFGGKADISMICGGKAYISMNLEETLIFL